MSNDPLVIAGKSYQSRLLVGTGKYKYFAETRAAIDASGAEIITVAIRRTNIGQEPGQPSLLEVLPPAQFTILPNTAGCYTADDAVRTLRLARELLDGHPLCKLEVLGDPGNRVGQCQGSIDQAGQSAQGFKLLRKVGGTDPSPILRGLQRHKRKRGQLAGKGFGRGDTDFDPGQDRQGQIRLARDG